MSFPSSFVLLDNVLRINSIGHPDIKKSDGFIFALNGHYMLHDGGKYGTDCLDRLLALREAAGVEVLHFDWIISHFHVDHVGAPLENVVRDSRFAIDRIIMPPVNALPEGMIHVSRSYTNEIMEVVRDFHPNCEVTVIPFYSDCNKTFFYNFGGTEIEILPADTDWASPELLKKISTKYFCTDDVFFRKVQMYVVNISSIWFIIRHGGKKLIFTGDSPKRTRFMTDEGFDRMVSLFGDKIAKPDLFKWPHHGQAEDEADTAVRDIIDPDYILTTCPDEGASVQYQKTYPTFRAKFVNSCKEDVIITVAEDKPLMVEGGTWGVNQGEYFVLDIPGKKVWSPAANDDLATRE